MQSISRDIHVTPPFISLHCLPITARIRFKNLMFPYNSQWISTHLFKVSHLALYCTLSHPLKFSNEWHWVIPSPCCIKSHSKILSRIIYCRVGGVLVVGYSAMVMSSGLAVSYLQHYHYCAPEQGI